MVADTKKGIGKMNGDAHVLVTNIAMALLEEDQRHILYPRWGGIESGATLSDHFRIMWEPDEINSNAKQLVHRCYVDSDDPKDHGCVTRAWDHASGCISFIEDYKAGELEGAYDEDSFLENMGMFLGVTSHHIADLCTPVHVGHKIDLKALGYSKLSQLHKKVERDIGRLINYADLRTTTPTLVDITKEYFWAIAKETYGVSFLELEKIYGSQNEDSLRMMVSDVLSRAVKHTADVWHSVISQTNMTERKWSMQPLL